jgi:hypothetical protein
LHGSGAASAQDSDDRPKLAAGLVKTLPAQGLARAVSVLAMTGCAISLAIHLLALLGFSSRAVMTFQVALSVGVIAMYIPAVIAWNRLASGSPPGERLRAFNPRFTARVLWKLIGGSAPPWVRVTSRGLAYYAMAAFAVFAFELYRAKQASDIAELRMLSIYAAAFYSVSAMILQSYARSDRIFGPDEL